MAKFRKVHTRFWDDPLMERLSPDCRYFYLFLMTNPLCTECGIYQITIKKMCNYTGYNEDAIKALIKVFEVDNSRIVYSVGTEEMCVLKKPNYIENTGKPVVDCLNSEFQGIKNKNLILRQINHIDKEPVKKIYDAWYVTYCDAFNKLEQEKEKEKEKEYKQNNDASPDAYHDTSMTEKVWRKDCSNFLKDKIWKENFCMAKAVEMEDLEKSMNEFIVRLNLQEDYKNVGGLKRHYTNHYNKHGLVVSEMEEKKKSSQPKIKL